MSFVSDLIRIGVEGAHLATNALPWAPGAANSLVGTGGGAMTLRAQSQKKVELAALKKIKDHIKTSRKNSQRNTPK